MKIIKTQFVRGATNSRQWPSDGFPEIAFAGRSNVGKSSLINKLLARKNLAIVSKTPGRTRQINFFLVNDVFYFVDLPGYGFARVSLQEKQKWGKMIEDYLQNSPALKGMVLILDIRRIPNEDDLQILDWCRHFKLATLIALTKADKVSGNVRTKQRGLILKAIEPYMAHDAAPPILFSAKDGRGRSEILRQISQWT